MRKLRPSSADSWSYCPAFARAAEEFQETRESPHALEGTQAHEVAENAILEYLGRDQRPTAPDITSEMEEGAKIWLKAALDHGLATASDIQVEKSVHNKGLDMSGSPDLTFVSDGRLVVMDYKFGFRPVRAAGNKQMSIYADSIRKSEKEIVKVIVQPRTYVGVDSVTISEMELALEIDDITEYASVARLPEPPARPGTGCKYCTGKHACGALRDASLEFAEYVETSFESLDPKAAPRELGILEDAKAVLDYRIGALTAELEERLKKGESVEGYVLHSGRSSKKWADPEAVMAVADLLGVDLRAPQKLKTPNQAKELISEDLIKGWVEVIPGKLKLKKNTKQHLDRIFGKGEQNGR